MDRLCSSGIRSCSFENRPPLRGIAPFRPKNAHPHAEFALPSTKNARHLIYRTNERV